MSPDKPSPGRPDTPVQRLALLLATCFGLGYLPRAPGTFGALGGLGLLLLLHLLLPTHVPGSLEQPLLFSILLIALFALGVWSSNRAERSWGHDASRIVIDEWLGMWISLAFLPLSWPMVLAAFLLFRFFDIAKPMMVRRAEGLSGGWGVMLDDVLAGIYTQVLLRLALFTGWISA